MYQQYMWEIYRRFHDNLNTTISSVFQETDLSADASNFAGLSRQMKRQDVLLSLVHTLKTLKFKVQKEHNITITSAVIARPDWMGNELNDLVDEAVLRAGIESWQQSEERTSLALMTVDIEPGDRALLLQHSLYHFSIHERSRETKNRAVSSTMSGHQFSHLTGSSLLHSLALRLINSRKIRSEDSNVAQSFSALLHRIDQVRWNMTHDLVGDPNIPFVERNASIDLSGLLEEDQATGILRGRDIQKLGDEMIEGMVETILSKLFDHDGYLAYIRGTSFLLAENLWIKILTPR
jgi:hypothetical protein